MPEGLVKENHPTHVWRTLFIEFSHNLLFSCGNMYSITVVYYLTAYGILPHELPVVSILFTQSNNNEGTMKR